MEYRLISGSCETQGRRETMEDTHKHIDDVKEVQTFDSIKTFSKVAYYGVYDGHGGDQTAKMVENALHPKILLSQEFTNGDVRGALHKGFEEMDKVIVEEANNNNWMNGSTCVCGLVLDGSLYVANIGDSEGILVSVVHGKTVAKNMTRPHKATDPQERERIESLGGHVFFGRLFGTLAVSRSFGDAKYKKPRTSKDFVSWEPDIQEEKLTPEHQYIILACDGLWDVMSHDYVAELTHRSFNEGQSPQQVARTLVREAITKKTEDNVTVIVVKIDWTSLDDDSSSSSMDDDIEQNPEDQQTSNTNVDAPTPPLSPASDAQPQTEQKADETKN